MKLAACNGLRCSSSPRGAPEVKSGLFHRNERLLVSQPNSRPSEAGLRAVRVVDGQESVKPRGGLFLGLMNYVRFVRSSEVTAMRMMSAATIQQ